MRPTAVLVAAALVALTACVPNRIKGSGRTPWCYGLQSGTAPGWPGTDWIADIVLRQAGPQRYQAESYR